MTTTEQGTLYAGSLYEFCLRQPGQECWKAALPSLKGRRRRQAMYLDGVLWMSPWLFREMDRRSKDDQERNVEAEGSTLNALMKATPVFRL